MLLAFTDESYSQRNYYQAAFIVQESALIDLERLIIEAKQYATGFGVLSDVEYHGNSIMSAVKGWEPLAKKYGAKIAIFKDFLNRVALTNGTLLIQGVDIARLNNRYSYPDSPHEITHKNLLDAIDRFAESQKDLVRIFSDQVDTETRLQSLFSIYQENSTGGPFPRRLQNVDQIEYVASHHHAGIQIADLCVFLYRRMEDHVETNPKTATDVKKLWEILQPRIHPNFQPRVWRP